MADESYTDAVDAVDQSMDDSPVIKALRKQVKDLETQVKSAPTREAIEAEIRTELERSKAITEQLIALGHPAGMSATVNGKLGDAEVTADAVAEVLRGIGYQVGAADAPEGDGGQPAAQADSDLAKVATLSAQVATAATGTTSDSLIERINSAKDSAELQAIMASAELLQSN